MQRHTAHVSGKASAAGPSAEHGTANAFVGLGSQRGAIRVCTDPKPTNGPHGDTMKAVHDRDSRAITSHDALRDAMLKDHTGLVHQVVERLCGSMARASGSFDDL